MNQILKDSLCNGDLCDIHIKLRVSDEVFQDSGLGNDRCEY